MKDEKLKKVAKRINDINTRNIQEIKELNDKKIHPDYIIFYMDTISLPEIKYCTKSTNFFLVIGVTRDYKREILVFEKFTDRRFDWEHNLRRLRKRNFSGFALYVPLIISPDIEKLNIAIDKIFWAAKHQRSLTSLEKSLKEIVPLEYKKIFTKEFKHLFGYDAPSSDNKDAFNNRLFIFCKKWNIHNNNIEKIIRKSIFYYTQFYDFQYEVRDMIKTTVWINDLKNYLRKKLKGDDRNEIYFKILNYSDAQKVQFYLYDGIMECSRDYEKPINRFKYFREINEKDFENMDELNQYLHGEI